MIQLLISFTCYVASLFLDLELEAKRSRRRAPLTGSEEDAKIAAPTGQLF